MNVKVEYLFRSCQRTKQFKKLVKLMVDCRPLELIFLNCKDLISSLKNDYLKLNPL